MKRIKFLSMLLLMLVTTFSFAACSDDDDENGSGLVITNSSTYTLQRFRVVFITAQGETLSDREYGTFYPGAKQEIPEIPAGAAYYYMATYANNMWFFSVNYEVSVRNLSITTDVIGEWRTNTSSTNRMLRDMQE